MSHQALIDALNAANKTERLDALRKLMRLYEDGTLQKPAATNNVNNHIHSTYSFSPYSPAKAAYMAWNSGLTTAGIMDHDSIAGAEEFIEACKIIGIAGTAGFECRCSLRGTPFEGKRINNPDQDSVAYLAMHGIPHQNIAKVQAFLTPYREKRNVRNRKMVDNINTLLKNSGLQLSFDEDVEPISMNREGGSITERHILYALSLKIMQKFGPGPAVLDFLSQKLGIEVTGGAREKLLDAENSMYAYYLLGVLKGHMVEQFYIDATDECPHITDFVQLAREIGAISAYAYLGDVGDSVTGDKKTQRFEDAFLDELVDYLAKIGFMAVTYMPTRNTSGQLARLISLCDTHGLFQISGEDINSPFQSFICEALQKPQFAHLITSTWALIGHEMAASADAGDGMFSTKTRERMPSLAERVEYFANYARQSAVTA